MLRRLRVFSHSLGARLLLPLLTTVVLILAVYSFFNFRSIQDHYLRFVQAESHRSADMIKRATHDGMLLNRLNEVQGTVQRLAESPDFEAIRVFDKNGRIALSSLRNELGQQKAVEDEACSICHEANLPLSSAVRDTCSLGGMHTEGEMVRHLSVIINEPSCAAPGCHRSVAEEKILGVLEVSMSLQPLRHAEQAARAQVIWMTLAMILIIGGIAAIFIRRLVHYPIRQLYEGTERIAGGDLDTRIEVEGEHELAKLAEAFNYMALDLGRAREELTQWSQRLEEKVVEKTEELQHAQRQVLHMEKMASLGKLSATVAHELNNPISGVLTYARLVQKELSKQPLDPEMRDELMRYLGLIDKECSRCGGIVQNLLLFARKRGAEKAPVDLNEIVERSLMLVQHHMEMAGVELSSELLRGDTSIIADSGQLQQALVALLVNAVEAMQGVVGARQLSVRLRGDAKQVHIEVQDTGVGISDEVRAHIFEPFFSTKGKESGVGLGLAVAYGIVNRHQGSIAVDSELGKGTTFTITIPRQPSGSTPSTQKGKPAPITVEGS